MSETKHTPGPWEILEPTYWSKDFPNEDGSRRVYALHVGSAHEEGLGRALWIELRHNQTADGDAHLIAAAPDLLALANRVVEIFAPMQAKGQNGHTFELLLRRAEAAIAKATGVTT